MATLSSLNAQRSQAGAAPISTKVDTRGNVVTLQGKQTPRSATFKAAQQSASNGAPSGAPEPSPSSGGGGFASDVMRMIAGIPAGAQRDKILSAFQEIQSQPADVQKQWFDSLLTQAQTATAPQYQQDVSRTNEKYGYTRKQAEQNKDFANQTYQRAVQNLDANALRQKAQDNKVLGDVLSRITSDSFVTHVAGSGIVARRMQLQRESAQETAQANDAQNSQQRGGLDEQLNQYLARQNLTEDRSQQLQGNELTDLGQQNTYDTQSLFLDLFKNENADTQNQLMRQTSTPQDQNVFTTTGQVNQKTQPGAGQDLYATRRQVRLAQQGKASYPVSKPL